MSRARAIEWCDPFVPPRVGSAGRRHHALGLGVSEWSCVSAIDPAMRRALVREAERVLAGCIGVRAGRTWPFE